MKICYLADGISIHDQRFILSLVERGIEMHLISFYAESLPKCLNNRKIIIHHIKSLARISPSHVLGKNMYLRTFIQVYPGAALPLILRQLLNSINPDIIHSGFLHSYGLYAALVNQHPILSMPWGSDVLIYPKRSIILRQIAKFVLSRADMVTCDCQLVKQEILRLVDIDEDKIIMFPWGVDLTVFYPFKNCDIIKKLGWLDEMIVIHDRAFMEVYGVEYLIDAIPKVIKQVPRARFLLCGSGPLEGQLKRRIKLLGVQNYVHFTGFINNHELPNYLNSADIYVSSSVSDGTSVSLLEAMACGLPVVVSDLPSNREWISPWENGLIVPKRNPEALAQGIIELLKSDDLRREFGMKNLSIARKRANWKQNIDILIDIYNRLLDARK